MRSVACCHRLESAKQTGAWGKMGSEGKSQLFLSGEKRLLPVDMAEAITHMERCQARRNALRALVARSDEPVLEVTFEQIYSNPEAGQVRVHEILDYFGLDRAEIRPWKRPSRTRCCTGARTRPRC